MTFKTLGATIGTVPEETGLGRMEVVLEVVCYF